MSGLCTQPLGHIERDGVYYHRGDGSYCNLLNDISLLEASEGEWEE